MKKKKLKTWTEIEAEAPVIDDICPVCLGPVEMDPEGNYVLETDCKPWRLYHKVCYRMSHPTQKKRG